MLDQYVIEPRSAEKAAIMARKVSSRYDYSDELFGVRRKEFWPLSMTPYLLYKVGRQHRWRQASEVLVRFSNKRCSSSILLLAVHSEAIARSRWAHISASGGWLCCGHMREFAEVEIGRVEFC
jgi:hypothetical protein